MFSTIRKSAVVVAALGAFGLGGAAIAGAAGSGTDSSGDRQERAFPGGPGGPGAGETALTGDTKTKVEAAVKAKYPNATIERTETNAGSGAPYESHVTTSDGTELEVLVSTDFAVVGANEHPARP